MNNHEIDALLKDYKDCYVGCFARDQLPKQPIEHRPFACVVNTDFAANGGLHWVALFVTKDNTAEYFDSFGQRVNLPEIVAFLENNNVRNCVQNTKQIQNAMSSTCGIYCVLFIKLRCRGLEFLEFAKYFSENTIRNDIKAYVSLLL